MPTQAGAPRAETTKGKERIEMERICVYEDNNAGRRKLVGWFDRDSATAFDEDPHWRGSYDARVPHERLYRTRGGRWVLQSWSEWRGDNGPKWRFVSANDARYWLGVNGHEDAARQYCERKETTKRKILYARDIATAVYRACGDVIADWKTRPDRLEILFLTNGYWVGICDTRDESPEDEEDADDDEAGGITWTLWDSNDNDFYTDGWSTREHTDAQIARFVEEIIEKVRRLGNGQSPFAVR